MNASDNKIKGKDKDKNKINDTTEKKKETDLKENLKQKQELGQQNIENNKIKIVPKTTSTLTTTIHKITIQR